MPTTELEYVSFRYFLQERFLELCSRNSAYSVRAFAKRLEIHPGTLSQILSAKRPISRATYLKLSKKLKISPRQRAWFEKVYERKAEANRALPKRGDVVSLNGSEQEVASGWLHYAVLELIKTRGFEPSVRYVAERLNITVKTAERTITQLFQANLLKVNESGQWVPGTKNLFMVPEVSNEAIKTNVQENIVHAARAYAETPFRKGYGTYIVFSFDREKVKTAIERLDDLSVRLVDELDDGGPYDEVYCLTTVLFPVTRVES